MQSTIIGFIGSKGAGKDTAAARLVMNHGFTRIAFADALKEEVSQQFKVSLAFLEDRAFKETPRPELALKHCLEEGFVNLLMAREPEVDAAILLSRPRSPREILQLWGTEYRRQQFADDYWVSRALQKTEGLTHVVFTDVRLKNEMEAIRSLGGYLVRIQRPGIEREQQVEREQGGAAAHKSETDLLTALADFNLVNVEGNIDTLNAGVDWMHSKLGFIQKACAAKDKEAARSVLV